MAKRKVRHKPPSRIRYEQSHPAIAFRVSRELYEEAKDMVELTGHSFADLFKIGMDKLEAKLDKFGEEMAEEAYDIILSAVPIGTCKYCGKPIIWDLTDEEDKKKLNELVNEKGYYHTDCKK